MRVKDVADRLEISPSLVYRLIAEQKLQATRHGSARGALRVSEDQLIEYLESCRVMPAYQDGPLQFIR